MARLPGPLCTPQHTASSRPILNGQPVSDDVLSPGWSSYEWRLRYRSYDVTVAASARRRCSGIALGNGWFRGRLGWSGGGASTATSSPPWRSSRSSSPTATSRSSSPTRPGPPAPRPCVANDLYDGQTIDARRCSDAWLRPGFSDDAWTGVHPIEFDFSQAHAVHRSAGAPPGGAARRSRSGPRRPARRWSTSGRTWSAGCGSPCGARPAHDHRAARRGARARRAGHPAAAHAPRPPTVHPQRRRRRLRADLHLPRLPLRRGRRLARRAHRRRTSTPSWSPPSCGGSASSSAPTRCSTSCTATWSGARAATSSTCPPTARSATSGSAGPVTSRCSPRPPPSSSTSTGFLRDWLVDLDAEQQAADGMVPFVVPDVLEVHASVRHSSRHRRAPRSGATRRCGCRGRCGRRTATGRCSSDQYDSMSAHVRRVESLLSPTGLWDTGFQFGDWLDPTAPPDHPSQAKADNGVVATACLYRTARIVAETAALLGNAATMSRHFAHLADRTRAAFHKHYVNDDGTIHSDWRRSTRWPSPSACSTARQQELAGDRLAELVAESGYRISDRLRRDAVHQRRADRDRSPRRRLPRCCSSGSARRGSTR